MTIEEVAKVQSARKRLMDLQKEIPMRPRSPYGALDIDDSLVQDIARAGHEAITLLLKAIKI